MKPKLTSAKSVESPSSRPQSGRPQSGRPASGRPQSGRPQSGRPTSYRETRAHVPSGAPTRVEKRRSLRFDKAFPVALRSDSFGEMSAIARNVSTGGMMVEVREPLPLGTQVMVFFSLPDSHARVTARGEVKNHYFLNFSDGKGGVRALSGMGLRFSSFESDSDLTLGMGISRLRTVLH